MEINTPNQKRKYIIHHGVPSWHQRKAGHCFSGSITGEYTPNELASFLAKIEARGEPHRVELAPLPKNKEIEVSTMKLWLSTGAITETERGEENIYFVNEFGHTFFCKCL